MENKPHNEELRQKLVDYRQRNNLSISELANQLGYTSSPVSKYIAGKPEGDIDKLERVIADVLKNESRRKQSVNDLFETPFSRLIAGAFETILETNDVGLVCGPAGIGKTSGIQIYHRSHPASILITVSAWSASPSAIASEMFGQLDTSRRSSGTRRCDYITEKLSGSNRLIIFDNAHKLTKAGIRWIFDLHDATGCPVALSGNPEILDLIRKNDQHFSRIGLKKAIDLRACRDSAARNVALKIVEQIAPEAKDEVSDLVETVAEQRGHFRAVRKQIILARKIKENAGDPINWATAFKAAHTQLVRDYQLN